MADLILLEGGGGAGIAFVDGAYSALAFSGSSRSLTFAATPADGEIILLAYVQNDSTPATRTWPSGFVELAAGAPYSPGQLAFAWKRAASESGATYTLNLGDAFDNNQELIGGRYSGAFGTGDPFEVVSSAGGGFASPQNAPNITTLSANAWHIIIHGSNNDAPGAVAATGYTNDVQPVSNPRLALLHKLIVTAGATGAVSVSNMNSSGNPNILYSLALKPATGGGGADYMLQEDNVSRFILQQSPVTGIAAIIGQATIAALARLNLLGQAALAGQATIVANGTNLVPAIAPITGQATVAATGTVIATGAQAAIAGTSAVSGVGTVTRLAQAAVPGTGTVAANATEILRGQAAIVGAASISALGGFVALGQAAITGAGAVLAAGTKEVPGIASLSGSAVVSADGREIFAAQANIAGAATLAPNGVVTITGAAALAGAGALSATGTNQKLGQAAIVGVGVVTAVGNKLTLGVGLIAGGGNITAVGRLTHTARGLIAGAGNITATPRWIGGGRAFIVGQATITATVLLVIPFPPQRIRADVYSAAGVRLGDGPLMDILDAGYAAQLDQIGQWSVTVPATSDRVELLAHGNEVWLYREGEGLVFKGIIARVVSKASPNGEIALTASGFSIAARLAWKTSGVGRQYVNSTFSTIVTDLFSGTGWTLTYDGTMPTDPTDARIDGASRWYAVSQVCDRFGEHMRDLSPGTEVEVGPFGAIADMRLQNVDTITPELRFNGKMAAIVGITVTEDSADIVNRLFAYGGEGGDNQLDLSVATLSSPYTVLSAAAPTGGTRANYYIEDTASQTAYGVREEIVTSKDIAPLDASDAGFERMANMLYIGAVNEMLRRKDPVKAYDIDVVTMQHYRGGAFVFFPGDKLSVLYRGIARGIDGTSVYLDLNTNLWLMGYTRSFNQDGSDSWRLSVSTIDRKPKNSVVEVIEDHSTDKGRRKIYNFKRVDGPIQQTFDAASTVGDFYRVDFAFDDNDLLLSSCVLKVRCQSVAPAPTGWQFAYFPDGFGGATFNTDADFDMLAHFVGNYGQPDRSHNHWVVIQLITKGAGGSVTVGASVESVIGMAGIP